MRKAFTLFELIVVLVITGILAVISTDVMLNIYRGYLQSRSINTLETQTEIVLEQIAKRLMYRIKESTIARNEVNNRNFISTADPGLNQTFTILEWINYSYESFQDGGWSGFIDLQHASTGRPDPVNPNGTLETPGSNLAAANATISSLTGNQATLNNSTVGIYFRGLGSNVLNSFGYNGTPANSIGIVTINNATNLNLTGYAIGADITENYYLLHTAYAIVPSAVSANGDFNLTLRYNYRPWLGANNQFNSPGISNALLATNVTRFNFTEVNGMMVLKLCMRDAGRSLDIADNEATVCKTKAVY